MEHVRIDEVDNSVQPAAVMRHLTRPLGCEDLAINYYELDPGDSFAFAYHQHEVQEEVFVVLAGTATWETEEGTVEVGPNEAIRVPPGEFQRGWNKTDEDGDGERVRAIALGAPLEYGDQPKYADCDDCGEETRVEIERADDDDDAVVTICQECGSEVGRWVRGDDGENERVV
jgi:uncharacterized cupin superfamily protein